MTIAVGDTLPAGQLSECTEFNTHTGCPLKPNNIDVLDAASGKKILIFGVPGAFTPLCSEQHLPGYIALADQLKNQGVDEIWCMAVNDAFVMASWGTAHHNTGQVRMLGDGSAIYSKALGLDRDLTAGGMGIRCFRFAMLVNDGKVEYLASKAQRNRWAEKRCPPYRAHPRLCSSSWRPLLSRRAKRVLDNAKICDAFDRPLDFFVMIFLLKFK